MSGEEYTDTKITVIIPTYCPGLYLWECLNSLYEQTLSYGDYEIVLVLNGCNEPYNSQILSYLASHADMMVQYVQTDEKGVSYARNIALDIASGDYIAFVDDDDYVSPSYLEELLNISNPHTIGIAYAYAFSNFRPYKQLPYQITSEYDRCSSLGVQSYTRPKKYFSGPCMKLIHVAIIGRRRFDTRFNNGEDSLFMFLLSDRMDKVSFTSRKAVYYRRFRENSANANLKELKYVIAHCRKMFFAYSSIYFRNILRYNLCRYLVAILGLCHILINAMPSVQIKRT